MRQLGSIQKMGVGRAAWTLRNDGPAVQRIHLEPEGDQIDLRPGSTIVIQVEGGTMPNSANDPIEVSTDGKVITVWSTWPGNSVAVTIDGKAH